MALLTSDSAVEKIAAVTPAMPAPIKPANLPKRLPKPNFLLLAFLAASFSDLDKSSPDVLNKPITVEKVFLMIEYISPRNFIVVFGNINNAAPKPTRNGAISVNKSDTNLFTDSLLVRNSGI